MRYIIIDEYGTCFTTDEIGEAELQATDDGILSNLIDTEEEKEYFGPVNGWIKIAKWEESK